MDYTFGNRLFEMRKSAGYTQRALAGLLGVSDKAVSRWENGSAKPSTDLIRKLAALYHVSVDELLRLKELPPEKKIAKIVLTGGPCAGKTTALNRIRTVFTKEGYTVLIVPETATELITGGISPGTVRTNLRYQVYQMRLQLEKERIFEEAAREMKEDKKVLIVCDRGALDNKAYMDDAEFAAVLREVGKSEIQLRDTYDAVFHLVTAAKGAEAFYTKENNTARKETPSEAAVLDDRLIASWTGHPHLRVIGNETDFEEKMRRLTAEIAAFLGEPEPLEVERKYLIRYPDMAWLAGLPNCRRIEIIQTYLNAPEGEEIRVRQRGAGGDYVYYETRKKKITGLQRVEIEKRLSREEYLDRLMDADTSKRQIRKDRFCLTYEGQYLEIDVYPFWTDRAILEAELRDPDQSVKIPEKIRVIREVTEEDAYKNVSLAAGDIPWEMLPAK